MSRHHLGILWCSTFYYKNSDGIQRSLPAPKIIISNTEFFAFWIFSLERNVQLHKRNSKSEWVAYVGLCLLSFFPHRCSLNLSERDPFAIHRQHMNRMLSGSFGFGPLLGITDGTTPGARQAGRRMQVRGAEYRIGFLKLP